ncbi:MAG: Vacuolar membrane protease [Marteilia pararefringens]
MPIIPIIRNLVPIVSIRMSEGRRERSQSVCSLPNKEFALVKPRDLSKDIILAYDEIKINCHEAFTRNKNKMHILIPLCITIGMISAILLIFEQATFEKMENSAIFQYSYWIFLGFLSSFGIGSGFPTFTLYLAPFIANNFVMSRKCKSLDFLVPPYPWKLECPENSVVRVISNGDIFRKVFSYSFAWGIGTALGELPPYLIAKSIHKLVKLPIKRLSMTRQSINFIRRESLDNSLDLLEENTDNSIVLQKKNYIEQKIGYLIKSYGFIAIIVLSSVPNPFFDVAGIACGHFDVSLPTFLSATLIGKAIIKSQVQTLFMITSIDRISRSIIIVTNDKLKSLFSISSKCFVSFAILYYIKAIIKELADVNYCRRR